MPKKYLFFTGLTLTILALSLAILSIYVFKKDGGNSKPSNAIMMASQYADFNIYTPQNLPKNYKFDETSSTYSANVLTYRITNNHDQTITVTQQAKPEQIDMQSFSGLRFETDLGKASSLSDENTLSTALITKDNVLILLTAQKTTNLDSIKAVINSLQKL